MRVLSQVYTPGARINLPRSRPFLTARFHQPTILEFKNSLPIPPPGQPAGARGVCVYIKPDLRIRAYGICLQKGVWVGYLS